MGGQVFQIPTSMSYESLKKEELIAALKEQDAANDAIKEALGLEEDGNILEGVNTLLGSVTSLQEENAKLASKPAGKPVVTIGEDDYYLNAKSINFKGDVIQASDLIENPDGEFDEVLAELVESGSGLIEKAD